MSHKSSLEYRGLEIFQILQKPDGLIGTMLKVLDLENELAEAKAALREVKDTATREEEALEFPNAIQISEFADMDGTLRNPPDEKIWIESLSQRTKLDIRAILTELPTETGLHKFVFAHKKNLKLLYAAAKVWVIPVREGDCS